MDQTEKLEETWDDSDEYWASKTGNERIEAVEKLRRQVWGDDPEIFKVQKVVHFGRFPEDEERSE
jgi:hypothetical protein